MNEFERAKASHEEKMQKGYKQSKTADEMFEDIKYLKKENEFNISYLYDDNDLKKMITFHLKLRKVSNTWNLNVGELKAIHQKALELEWLDE